MTAHHANDDPILRHLSWMDDRGQTHWLTETEIARRSRPVVILAEPGGGKTWLLKRIAATLGTKPIAATTWVRRVRPAAHVVPGKPVLIDGLDEASARRDGDAIGDVLAKLDEAGAPHFVLTCRAADWDAYATSAIRSDYAAPMLCRLEPVTREAARAWLGKVVPTIDMTALFDALDMRGLADMTGNPLLLRMIGDILADHGTLPTSRADLYAQTTGRAWQEHNDAHSVGVLARLSEADAVDAAGAVCGAMLLGRYDAIVSDRGADADGALRITEVAPLCAAGAARAILGSKLFRSDGPGRFVPLHRTIAEYLGARWLASRVTQSTTPWRVARRLLARLQPGGIVPASVRGLHAWLPHFSDTLGQGAIACDPYGVLRYGEIDALDDVTVGKLLDGLVALAERDPYFRAQDWARQPITGLMREPLADRIAALIGSSGTNDHLRMLLIEGVGGTPLAKLLSDTLEAIVRDDRRFPRERGDALKALEPVRDLQWRLAMLETLRGMGDAESAHLAVELLTWIGPDVTGSAQTVAVLLADAGLTLCAWPQRPDHRANTVTSYHKVTERVADDQLFDLLDEMTAYTVLWGRESWSYPDALVEALCVLASRAVPLARVEDAARVWPWFRAIGRGTRYDRDAWRDLEKRIGERTDLRRAIQQYVVLTLRPHDTLIGSIVRALNRAPGLALSTDDLHALATVICAGRPDVARDVQDWRDLLRCLPWRDGVASAIELLARGFAGDNPDLLAELEAALVPPPPDPYEERDAADRQR